MAITGEMAFRFLHDEGYGFLADIIVAQYVVELVQKLKAAAIRIAAGEAGFLAEFSMDTLSVPGAQTRWAELEALLHPLLRQGTLSSSEILSILSKLRLNAFAAISAPPRTMTLIVRMRVGHEIEDPIEDFYVQWNKPIETTWNVVAAPKHMRQVPRMQVVVAPQARLVRWRAPTPPITLASPTPTALMQWDGLLAHHPEQEIMADAAAIHRAAHETLPAIRRV